MNNASTEVFRATISGIWIGLGTIILVCGAGCLIATAAGNDSTLWCGVSCVAGGPALIGAGFAAYYLFGLKRGSSN